MTDTPKTNTGPQPSLHPSDILLNLITTLLAPMFLSVSGGDIGFARLAALDTVTSYRSRHSADLIAIAQIVAFGLAALGSLSLSMEDNLSLSMTLRLRGNANALNRSAEQNRRAMQANRAEAAAAERMRNEENEAPSNEASSNEAPSNWAEVNEAEVLAQVAQAQRLVAEAQAQPPQTPAAPTTAAASARDQQIDQAHQLDQSMWEAAMADAARAYDACQTDAQRRAARIYAVTLNQLRPSPDVLSPAEPSPAILANQPPHHQQVAGTPGYSAALGFSASPASPAAAEVSPR